MFYTENKEQTKEKTYRPLPDYITIQPSRINGLGLFTLRDIPAGKNLGMTHAQWIGEIDNLLRTPLGGFINHSDTPNCKTSVEGRFLSIISITDIKEGEELTLKYTMYDPSM